MLSHIFQLFVLVVLLSSCGSLIKKKEIVSIDSYPRGAEVTQQKKGKSVKIGDTPFFFKTYEETDENFTFKWRDSLYGGEKVGPFLKTRSCGVEWTDPLVDKIPFLKKLIPDFVREILPEYNPINLIKGGRYECISFVRAKSEKVKKIAKDETCNTYLVLPPPHRYRKVSKSLIDSWEKKNFLKEKKSCDKIISRKISEVYFNFLGIDHLSRKYGNKYLGYSKISKLGARFKATHLVFLPYQTFGDTYTVHPEIYDIHLRVKNKKAFEKVYSIPVSTEKRIIFFDKLGDAFQFIPNSISLKFPFKRNLLLEPESEESNHSTYNTTLKIPPSIRLSNISFPHQNWGVNFRFSPSFSFNRWNREYNIKVLSGVMALKLVGHTPLGAIRGRFGFGGGHVWAAHNSNPYKDKAFTTITQWGLEYYTFLNQRFFLTLGFRRNNLLGQHIKDGSFKLRGYSSLFFNIGFYSPEMKMKIQSLFF